MSDPTQESSTKITKPHQLPTGIPPWHTVAFAVAVCAVAIPHLPSPEGLDRLSDPSVWTRRAFPDLVSLRMLAGVRLAIAGLALGLTAWLVMVDPGWDVDPSYKAKSKCFRGISRLQGLGTLCPFTSWCWLVLGLGFLTRGLAALAAVVVEETADTPAWAAAILENSRLMRATLVLWELTGPLAMLTSCAVKYAIWPQVLKNGGPHHLANFRNQCQHNLNSVFAFLEVTLLGGVPVEPTHWSMAALVGFSYMIFTWIMARFYFGSKETGPQYLYWFLDTTLEATTTIAVVALTSALAIFFGIFSVVVGAVLGDGSAPPNLPINVAFLVLGSQFTCKFKA